MFGKSLDSVKSSHCFGLSGLKWVAAVHTLEVLHSAKFLLYPLTLMWDPE